MARLWLVQTWIEFIEEIPRLRSARLAYMERILDQKDFLQITNVLGKSRTQNRIRTVRPSQLKKVKKPRRKRKKTDIKVKPKKRKVPKKKGTLKRIILEPD